MRSPQSAKPFIPEPMPVVHSLSLVLDTTFAGFDGPPFALRFWDGSVWQSPSAGSSLFELWFRNSDGLRALLGRPDDITFGELFIQGDVYINGDLVQVLRAWPKIQERLFLHRRLSVDTLRPLLTRLRDSYTRRLQNGLLHSKQRDRAAASFSFDQSPEFYRTFLGSSMMYSCGHFASESVELDEAQSAKLADLCAILDLRPGERFLDIGSGWGTVPLYATRQKGVLGFGIALSPTQVRFAKQRLQEEKLAGSCQIDQRDYRDLDIIHIRFDKATSLRTSEYVGEKNLPEYFRTVFDTLSPGGLFLNESVTRLAPGRFRGEAFADRFTFPDRELVDSATTVEAAKQAGFQVESVVDQRENYLRTFLCWSSALASHEHDALGLAEKHVIRAWKFYFAAMFAALEAGELGGTQILLRKPQD